MVNVDLRSVALCTWVAAFAHVLVLVQGVESWTLGTVAMVASCLAGALPAIWGASVLLFAPGDPMILARYAEALRVVGFTAQQLKAVGFSAAQLRSGGFSAKVATHTCMHMLHSSYIYTLHAHMRGAGA